jgi:hypothetical protein
MRNTLICLAVLVFLASGCCTGSTTPTPTSQEASSLPATYVEYRPSQAPTDTLLATLRYSSTLFLLTVSNSTGYPIELPTPPKEHCYANTFWFYKKTPYGWQPIQPHTSYFCATPSGSGELVPAGQEIEFDINSLLSSRDIHDMYPEGAIDYVIRIRYLASSGQELFQYANELEMESTSSIRITVEAVVDTLGFCVANTSSQPIWLAPVCSATRLKSGWMDEEQTTLQRATEAGSWLPIRSMPDDCTHMKEVIEIAAGETKMINGAAWLQNASISLPPGRYRWDAIIYHRRTSYGVEDGIHVFSDVFEYKE